MNENHFLEFLSFEPSSPLGKGMKYSNIALIKPNNDELRFPGRSLVGFSQSLHIQEFEEKINWMIKDLERIRKEAKKYYK